MANCLAPIGLSSVANYMSVECPNAQSQLGEIGILPAIAADVRNTLFASMAESCWQGPRQRSLRSSIVVVVFQMIKFSRQIDRIPARRLVKVLWLGGADDSLDERV